MGQGRRNMLASQRGAVGDGMVHAHLEGHPASCDCETRCLHGKQRPRQQAHVELRNKALEREHVMVLVAPEAAHSVATNLMP